MSITQPDILFTRPFAIDGTKAIITDTPSAEGRPDLRNGFPVETEIPLAAGGVPPYRADMNGLFYMMSTYLFWAQSGGQWTFRDTLDYAVPSIIWDANSFFMCLQESGPGTAAGVRRPSESPTYWQRMNFDGVPTGGILAWAGTLDSIPVSYGLCDGLAGRPNLLGRFLRSIPNSATNPGATGGRDFVIITIAEMPVHTHIFTGTPHVHVAPNHTHSFTGAAHAHTGPYHSHTFTGTAHVHSGPLHAHALSGGSAVGSGYHGHDVLVLANNFASGSVTTLDRINARSYSTYSVGNTTSAGLHTHQLTGNSASSGSSDTGSTAASGTIGYGGTESTGNTTATGTIGTSSGGNTGQATAAGTIENTGQGRSIDIRPTYYEVAFIVKL